MTNKRTTEVAENCVDMAMMVRDALLNGRAVVTEKTLDTAQTSMILAGVLADPEILRSCETLTESRMSLLLASLVTAGREELEKMQSGSILKLARPVREIQRDVILAALAEWDRRRAAAAEALQLCLECGRKPEACDCGRFEREG